MEQSFIVVFVYLSSSLKITVSLQRVYAVCFIVKTEDQQQHLVFRLFTSTLSYSGMSGSYSGSSSFPQGAPTQEAAPGSADPALPQVYAPPPSYPPPGQGPPTSASRLATLDFSSAHPSSEYQEHPQLRVYQGPQHDGGDSLTSGNTVRAVCDKCWCSRPIKHDRQ